MDREVERIIRMMSAVELAAWRAIGAEIPAGCPARFEAAAITREIIAEGLGRSRPAVAQADPVPMPAPAAKRRAG
jgi:hypothetical protein